MRRLALASILNLLMACASDPDGAQSAGSTGAADSTSDASATAAPTTGASEAPTATGSDASTAASTGAGDSTDGALTDASTGGASGMSTGDASTGDASTGDASTGDASTGDASTGDAGLGPAAEDAMAALMEVVAGVTYPSESDYPWTVVGLADAAPVSEANVKDVIAGVYVPHEGEAGLADRDIEVRTLAQLMDPLTVPKDWWTDENFVQAEKYTQIRDVLEAKLTNIQVFRLGEKSGNVLQGAVDVYVLGETGGGDIVGMWTVSVET